MRDKMFDVRRKMDNVENKDDMRYEDDEAGQKSDVRDE